MPCAHHAHVRRRGAPGAVRGCAARHVLREVVHQLAIDGHRIFHGQGWQRAVAQRLASRGQAAELRLRKVVGLVVVEQVFNLNGIGKWFVLAVNDHDFTVTQTLVLLFAAIFAITNFIVDHIYAWLDPRIHYN